MKNLFHGLKKLAFIGVAAVVVTFGIFGGAGFAAAAVGVDVPAIIQQVIDGAKGEMDNAVSNHPVQGKSTFETQVTQEMTTASSALESKLDLLQDSMHLSDQEIITDSTNEISMLGEDVSTAINSYYTTKIQEYRNNLTKYVADFIDQKQEQYGLDGDGQ